MKQEEKLIICKKALEEIVNFREFVPTLVELGATLIDKDGNKVDNTKNKKNYPRFVSDIKDHCLKIAKEALEKINS